MAAVLRGKEVAAGLTKSSLDELRNSLVTERVVYFPIRHHSPACSRHLEHLIQSWQPQTILIEGPASFTRLIPWILHPKTKAPFAVYTSFVRPEAGLPSIGTAALSPPRSAAYYPFCDYSPELVALRSGAARNAKLRFIDLDYGDQILAEIGPANQPGNVPRVESLLTERHLKRSEHLQALARRTGCRDHNDLWDHLFETRIHHASLSDQQVISFIQDVAVWCYFARVDASEAELQADGTAPRESAMARILREELAGETSRILVVTGGFHTVALPELASQAPPNPPVSNRRQEEAMDCLVRYSFEQLDALNGYSAGMPSPFYYEQLWQAVRANPSDAFEAIAAKVLVELGLLTRQKKLAIAVSTADEIAALEQSRRLASLRGHPGPTREDLLDGVRSCFVKGAMDAEGEIVLGLARHALAGTRIGEVPPEAGTPPIVQDFSATAAALRLNIKDSARRKNSLDLYRKAPHRLCSRFFHSVAFLEVPFCIMTAGPDFVNGMGLERLFEHWTYQWTPQTESKLVEASIYGATVEEAAANRLAQKIAELEQRGQGRCAAAAVTMLVDACRMGLHRHTPRLLLLISSQASADPSLSSLTRALSQLVLLWESREPLEAHRLTEIPALIRTVFERACYLLHNLAAAPPESGEEVLQSLIILRDLLRSHAGLHQELEPSLFYETLARALAQPGCPPLLTGGAAGLLYGDGRLSETELLKLLTGSLHAASAQPGDQTDFLVGLLRTCRELAWRQPALVAAIENLLNAWSEDEFIARIPHLRMAFADLTPHEADQVAEAVAALHGGETIGVLDRRDLSEVEMLSAIRVHALVLKSLQEDGLSAWAECEVKS